MILNEGGNVFPDVTPFDHANVPEILSKLQSTISDTGIRLIPVGSAATPKPGKKSGDMDVIADEEQVLGFFNAKDAKSARRALNDYISTKGFQTAQSGINVHVRVPVGSEAHQVDIMVTPKAEKVSRFHTHDIPDKSPYKGVNKQLMMAILAKQKGYMWSAWQGLFDRTAEGKKGDFISDDLDEIAQRLLGDGASSKNLGSVEAILRSLPEEEAQRLLAKAEEDPNWQPKKQEKVDEGPQHWFREISAKLENIERIKTGLRESQIPTDIPKMPDITGLQVGSPKDLGQGERIEMLKNGTISYSGGFGAIVYDKTGKAIKYQSPSLQGLTKIIDLSTGEVVDDYYAGPLQLRQTKDASGKTTNMSAKYDLGYGVVGQEKDYASGITTNTATPRGEFATQADATAAANAWLPTSAVAAAKGVDPKKFAKFQRQNPAATEALDAMLRIARLK